jgi:hypothetical protein
MTIVGFNFKKILAEKLEGPKGKININNNVSIVNVDEKKLTMANEKQKILAFTFEFTANYEPKIGEIKLVGDVLVMEDTKKAKDMHDSWKKDKKVPKELLTPILNTVLNKCNIQALIVSEQVGLPAPIPLPKLQQAEKQEK